MLNKVNYNEIISGLKGGRNVHAFDKHFKLTHLNIEIILSLSQNRAQNLHARYLVKMAL